MAEVTKTSTASRNRRSSEPPKEQAVVETNAVVNEFNSYNSIFTNTYFGINIFEHYSQEQLANIVKDPMSYNETLRKLSLMLYSSNGVFTNTVDYMTAMPTLDRVVVGHGANKRKKVANKEKMTSILHMIKDREIIRDALWKGMVEGVAFYYLETTKRPLSTQKFLTDFDVDSIIELNSFGVNASIISLPADYTKIIGIKNNSYVIAFNLDYFNSAEGETCEKKLRKYPEEIRKAYEQKIRKGRTGNWIALDNSKTIVHKIRSKRDEPWGRPLVLAAISDILYNDYFTDTKRNILDEVNNKIIYETFPEGREKGTSALTGKQQEAQHNAVKSAILSKNKRGGTSFFSVAAGTKIGTVDPTSTDLFDSKNESGLNDKIALGLGFAASLLSGTGTGSYAAQANNLDLLTSQLFQWIEQIENELNKVISENIIKDNRNWVECKYLPITNVNKKTMVGFAKDLYLQGKGSLTLWASACGISPDIFFSLLDQELEAGIEDKYPTHQTSFTLSDKKERGRPGSDTPSDSTIRNKTNGSDHAPTPSKQ